MFLSFTQYPVVFVLHWLVLALLLNVSHVLVLHLVVAPFLTWRQNLLYLVIVCSHVTISSSPVSIWVWHVTWFVFAAHASVTARHIFTADLLGHMAHWLVLFLNLSMMMNRDFLVSPLSSFEKIGGLLASAIQGSFIFRKSKKSPALIDDICLDNAIYFLVIQTQDDNIWFSLLRVAYLVPITFDVYMKLPPQYFRSALHSAFPSWFEPPPKCEPPSMSDSPERPRIIPFYPIQDRQDRQDEEEKEQRFYYDQDSNQELDIPRPELKFGFDNME